MAWLLGVPWSDAPAIGEMLGIKTVLNEFIAYQMLADARGTLDPRSVVIASYALCGFANFGSLGILLGGLGAMAEGIRPGIARDGLRAILAGSLATFGTGGDRRSAGLTPLGGGARSAVDSAAPRTPRGALGRLRADFRLTESRPMSGSDAGRVVAIAGATGAVGEVLLRVLEEREFPVSELRPLASERSAGKTVGFRNEKLVVEEARPEMFDGVDFVFFAATGTLSKELAPEAARRGAVAIDKSSTWRMDENVPLVVPEVNAAAVADHQGIISCPQLHDHPVRNGPRGTQPGSRASFCRRDDAPGGERRRHTGDRRTPDPARLDRAGTPCPGTQEVRSADRP